MKYQVIKQCLEDARSLSARRAWIEISNGKPVNAVNEPSLSARRAWIEISDDVDHRAEKIVSLSARRAWIEINCSISALMASSVALRKESVD